ncbi:hydroxymethylglutaryl-CoA synthase [Lapidilactobacillus achengensis]|uniref:Hydroxymethylglutaryl-CoA synthase n=1 Tax=Lapidilactobacillus achengensis TaxID=2486000 RepID=A0ABW1UN58_9LACO|nr:hydroxymethylglutaryl-CoA synthase [Lapidilactobacillus achengensis]
MAIGIDKIGFASPEFYLDLTDLAQARQVDPAKYHIGIGQDEMAVMPQDQDVVTLAAQAAAQILTPAERQSLDLIIFATESGVDQSKASALYVQRLLGLNQAARAIEIKEACYGATAGLQLAYDHLAAHPESQRVLVLGADEARYGLQTAGEVTQGAGAIALLVTRQPRILELEQPSAYHSEEVMDFWRPNYRQEALADGRFSTEQYLRFLDLTWADYQTKTQRDLTDLAAVIFHIPFTKLGLKGLRQLTATASAAQQADYLALFQQATKLNRRVGNLYTGSLYLSLYSLLLFGHLPAGARIGLYSYGSGAVAEFFSGRLVAGYAKVLPTGASVLQQLATRQRLTMDGYQHLFNAQLPTDGSDWTTPQQSRQTPFRLAGIAGHQRLYQNNGGTIQ